MEFKGNNLMCYPYEAKVKIKEGLEKNGITLNGLPAQVLGLRERFAVVTNGTQEGQWAWPTLAKMLDGGSHTLGI